MALPYTIRIIDGAVPEPAIAVDGHVEGAILELSHWPGNRTPASLKAELSTGIALRYVSLPVAERERLSQGARVLVNNHYDTDGILALFSLVQPECALQHRERLLACAAAGDLFRGDDERAFALDAYILAQTNAERYAAWQGHAKHERIANDLMRELPLLLAAPQLPHPEHWQAAVERLRRDQASLRAALRDEMIHLDLCVYTLEGAEGPGRHALFGDTRCDRALLINRVAGGTHARLVINTSSWFDIPGSSGQPRPDLAALAARLNQLEGHLASAPHAWRTHPSASPAPELWFGQVDCPFFTEHNPCLAPSRLDPLRIKREVIDAVRAAWVFPDAD